MKHTIWGISFIPMLVAAVLSFAVVSLVGGMLWGALSAVPLLGAFALGILAGLMTFISMLLVALGRKLLGM